MVEEKVKTNDTTKTKGRVLCLGDVHGGDKALVQVLERSNFDPSSDRIIFLGDVADCWPEVSE